jgi:hypothetical protein
MPDQHTGVPADNIGYPPPGLLPDLGLVKVVPHLPQTPK